MPDIDGLVMGLEAESLPDKKEWWERYLKGVIEFRGVPMAAIRRVVHQWHQGNGLGPDGLRIAADSMLRRSLAEDKLAGILIWQELLLPSGDVDWSRDLATLADLFDDDHIWDWNTTDWLCVRVLGPMAEQFGEPCARAIASWVDAPGLWRRRSAGVSFVGVAGRGDVFFAGFEDLVFDVCSVNVRDPERFAQTGVGWVLRELSDAASDRVLQFLGINAEFLSREALRMAAARLSNEQRKVLGLAGERTRR